jgi:hypothetical protein
MADKPASGTQTPGQKVAEAAVSNQKMQVLTEQSVQQGSKR